MNKFFIIGNLTRDPELKISGEKKRCRLSVAVNRYVRESGKQETDFIDVTAFDGLAESVAKFQRKGDRIFIEGKIRQNNYEDDKGKHYGYEFIAVKMEFLSPRKNDEADGDIPAEVTSDAE